MKIYTKTGDKGTTGLIGGTRVTKNDIRLEAYGSVDELNSFIGFLASYPLDAPEKDYILRIQHKLFNIGSNLATDRDRVTPGTASEISEGDIQEIEAEIDRMDHMLPDLKAFVLPGGLPESAVCHICRTVARRVERRLFDMNTHYPVDKSIFIFINRLSDYFFVLSRYLSVSRGAEEIYWKSEEE